METFRVIFKNGGWVDIEADYVKAFGDGHVRLWQSSENPAERFDKQIAILGQSDVWGVAIKGCIQDRDFIPDGTGNMIEILKDSEQSELSCREQLAKYAHAAWCGWIKHMFRKGHFEPAQEQDRWLRLAHTAYCNLTEDEKESDRAEADRILAIVKGKGD